MQINVKFSLSIYLFIGIFCVQDLTVVPCVAMNRKVHVSLQYFAFNSFRRIPRRGIAELNIISSFKFLRNLFISIKIVLSYTEFFKEIHETERDICVYKFVMLVKVMIKDYDKRLGGRDPVEMRGRTFSLPSLYVDPSRYLCLFLEDSSLNTVLLVSTEVLLSCHDLHCWSMTIDSILTLSPLEGFRDGTENPAF